VVKRMLGYMTDTDGWFRMKQNWELGHLLTSNIIVRIEKNGE
jgi:hypothetical protein